MDFKRDKKYDGTILHGLCTKNTPAFKPKQNKTPKHKKTAIKHSLSATSSDDKPSAGMPRYKVADNIWAHCAISAMRSKHGL